MKKRVDAAESKAVTLKIPSWVSEEKREKENGRRHNHGEPSRVSITA